MNPSNTSLSDFREAIEAETAELHSKITEKILCCAGGSFGNREYVNNFTAARTAILDFYIAQTDPERISNEIVFKIGVEQVAQKLVRTLMQMASR